MIHQARSYRALATCDCRLIDVVLHVAADTDIAVLCGHRDKEAQNRAVAEGRSRVSWPHGKHNSYPSRAVDLAPWPINWDDVAAFDGLGARVLEVAKSLGVDLRWGGHWKKLVDRPHFELAEGVVV